MLNSSIVRESANRAAPLNLEALIQKMDKEPSFTAATPRQVGQRREALRQTIEDPLVAKVRLERIIGGNDLTDISYLSRGLDCCRAVGRIVIRNPQGLLGYGTGFMVAPGVLLTNHHVISNEELASHSIVQFRYERDSRGHDLREVEFRMSVNPKPILLKELDMALVAIEPRSVDRTESLNSFGWLKLKAQSGKAFIGEYLTIIQHPNGERKQVCIRENRLLRYSGNGPYLWYQTDTVAGTSGSPVFNNDWDVVALHHSGVPRTKRVGGRDVWLAKNGMPWTEGMGEDEIDWIANEGVRISRIVNYLQTQQIGNPLAVQVLGAGQPGPSEAAFGEFAAGNGVQIQTSSSGRTRILVPIEIGINMGFDTAPPLPQPRPSPASSIPFIPTVIEAVQINQDNYDKRSGYDPDFLGSGFKAPLPKVVGTKYGSPLVLADKKNSELRYWNYSVVMNKNRALAFFSAANIHTGKFRGTRADGDTWYLDTRVNEVSNDAQIGKEFYKEQKNFEAKLDRTRNPFDQGHLSRRSDLQWGEDDEIAKRNGDDSFHYTNCAPQHWQFNQNNSASGLWYRLEDTAIAQNPGGKLSVINGPIFDAPLSEAGEDGWMRLNLKGKRVPDGTFGGFKIPKQFFKVIIYRSGGQLKARAFVVTQEDLLTTIDRYYPEESARLSPFGDMEVRLYQVTIPQLEKLASLDFGPLRNYDTANTEEAAMIGTGLPLQTLDQIIF